MQPSGVKVFECSRFGHELLDEWMKEQAGKVEILKTKELLTARDSDQYWNLIVVIYYRTISPRTTPQPSVG